jgi:hypothetical protein
MLVFSAIIYVHLAERNFFDKSKITEQSVQISLPLHRYSFIVLR